MFNRSLKPGNRGIATVLSFAVIPLSGLVTDIYIPSMPAMAADMHTSSAAVQLTLSFFLLSYGLSQLFIGSLVDSFGRYPFVIAPLLLTVITSILIANTQNINFVYFLRVVQGLTIACSVVAKRTLLVDIYEGKRLQSYLSSTTIIWSLAPIIAPFIGGYLQSYFGWHSNFYFLAAYASVILVLEIVFGGETVKNIAPFKLRAIAGTYKHMLTTPAFVLGLVMLALSYSMVIIYNMSGPFIIEKTFGLTPIVSGYTSLILGFAWMVGGIMGKVTARKDFARKLSVAVGLQIITIVIMLATAGLYSTVTTIVCFAFVIHSLAGYVFNNYFTFCLSQFPANAGTAGGLTGGGTYFLLSGFTGFIAAIIPFKGQFNLAGSYLTLSVVACILMVIIYRLSTKKARD